MRHRRSVRFLTVIAAVFWLADAALAHQDLILSVRPDGVIPGLPSAYHLTRLHISFSDGDQRTLQRLDFQSSGQETRVANCLLELLPQGAPRRLFLTGSWYHDEAIVPHYIQVLFRDPPTAAELPGDPGVSFLFSLRDATLLQVTKITPVPGERAVRDHSIRLVNGCPG